MKPLHAQVPTGLWNKKLNEWIVSAVIKHMFSYNDYLSSSFSSVWNVDATKQWKPTEYTTC